MLPKHINRETLKAVRDGLDYLARTQGGDGGWHDAGGQAYPVAVSSLAGMAFLAGGNTPTRGHYAQQVKQVTEYLLSCSTDNGLLTGPNQENGRPMHGHGFALMYLASVYGMESNRLDAQADGRRGEKGSRSDVARPQPRRRLVPTRPARRTTKAR